MVAATRSGEREPNPPNQTLSRLHTRAPPPRDRKSTPIYIAAYPPGESESFMGFPETLKILREKVGKPCFWGAKISNYEPMPVVC
jgi:hypothetical protein